MTGSACLHSEHHASEIDVDQKGKVFRLYLLDTRITMACACRHAYIVVQDINTTKSSAGGGHCLFDFILVANIQRYGNRFTTRSNDLLCCFFSGF